MTKLALKFLFAASFPLQALSFGSVLSTSTSWSSTALSSHSGDISQDNHSMSRRAAFVKSAIAVTGGINLIFGPTSFSEPAFAAVTEETPRVTTRMGGLLERYQDSRGWTILAPSGWNKFEGEVGAYDVKWQDVVDNRENIKISSNPVKSNTTSIDALGDVQKLGENLAVKRSAKLIRAEERQTDGILFYTFDFAISDGTHQLLLLCVNKGKVWSLDANSSEKRWGKREELYYNVLGSFMPKLA